MKLSSPAFINNQALPAMSGYKTGNINPPLVLSDIPEASRSWCLVVHDPDAPAGDYVHWLIWNMNIVSTFIESGKIPIGAMQGRNDYGNNRWDGPAPPNGTHRYVFVAYALNDSLILAEGSTRTQLEESIKGKVVDTAQLVGLYSAV